LAQSKLSKSVQPQQIDQRSNEIIAQINNNVNKLKEIISNCHFSEQDLEKLYGQLMSSDLESNAK
jgi:hypothetical protein